MKARDLTGQRFGRLTVLRRARVSGKEARWFCLCDCGEETEGLASSIASGKKKSCGCLVREINATRSGIAKQKKQAEAPASPEFLLQKLWNQVAA